MNRSHSLLFALFSRKRTLAPFFRAHTLTLSCSLALSLSHSSLSRFLALLLSRALSPLFSTHTLTLSHSLALSLSRSLALSLSRSRTPTFCRPLACFLFLAHTETTGWTLAWGSTLPDAKFKSMRPQVLCCSVLQCVLQWLQLLRMDGRRHANLSPVPWICRFTCERVCTTHMYIQLYIYMYVYVRVCACNQPSPSDNSYDL